MYRPLQMFNRWFWIQPVIKHHTIWSYIIYSALSYRILSCYKTRAVSTWLGSPLTRLSCCFILLKKQKLIDTEPNLLNALNLIFCYIKWSLLQSGKIRLAVTTKNWYHPTQLTAHMLKSNWTVTHTHTLFTQQTFKEPAHIVWELSHCVIILRSLIAYNIHTQHWYLHNWHKSLLNEAQCP